MPKGIYKHQKHTLERRRNIGLASKGRKHTIASRLKMSISKSGDKCYKWRGDKVKQRACHTWVAKIKPKVECCEYCHQKRKLGLANIRNHQYKRNIEDYRWLCFSCHGKMDKNKSICNHGHKMEGDNVIITKRGHRICKECHRIRNIVYRNKGETLTKNEYPYKSERSPWALDSLS